MLGCPEGTLLGAPDGTLLGTMLNEGFCEGCSDIDGLILGAPLGTLLGCSLTEGFELSDGIPEGASDVLGC